MERLLSLDTVPSFLVPFTTLSYPVPTPARTDSFHKSVYYDIGYRDACLMVTMIAVMAIIRDASRLLVFEPFAAWKLTRDWRSSKAHHHGTSTPPSEKRLEVPENSPIARRIQHNVTRFAEQGYLFLYYILQISFGCVSSSLDLTHS